MSEIVAWVRPSFRRDPLFGIIDNEEGTNLRSRHPGPITIFPKKIDWKFLPEFFSLLWTGRYSSFTGIFLANTSVLVDRGDLTAKQAPRAPRESQDVPEKGEAKISFWVAAELAPGLASGYACRGLLSSPALFCRRFR